MNPSSGSRAPRFFPNVFLEEQRSEHQRDSSQQLDQHVQGRAGRIFERIAHRVADYCRLVRFGSLTTVCAGLDVFLGVILSATAVIHQHGHEDADDRSHHKQGSDRLCTGKVDGTAMQHRRVFPGNANVKAATQIPEDQSHR